MREIDKKLFDAVSGMDTKLVQDLIAAGANIMARSEQNFTPLHHVLMPESAQLLIDSGADVMARTKTGQTPLHCAKTADVASVLLENGAAINAENKAGKTALWKFIELAARNSAIVRMLISKGANVKSCPPTRITPLHIAAAFGDVEFARLCIEHGADLNVVNTNGRTPLDTAVFNKREDMIHELTKRGAYRNDNSAMNDETPVISLYTLGVMLVGAIKEKGYVDSMLNLGADVNARDEDDATALHWAAYHGLTDLIERLFKLGAYVNARDNDGKTPLAYAKDNETKQLLIEHGATE